MAERLELAMAAPVRLSDAMESDYNDEPETMRLGDVMSLQRTEFDASGFVNVSAHQRIEWEAQGPIGWFEQARRQDKTEMIPFNPESAVKSVKLLNAVNRLKESKYTDGGQKAQDLDMVNRFLMKSEEERVRGFTIGGQIAQGVAALPGFMVEFLATGGVAAVGKKATVKAVEKVTGEVAKKSALGFTTRAAGAAGGAVARTAAMPHRVAEGYADRQVNASLELTQEGYKIAEESYEKPFISASKAFGDVVIENFSEVTGPVLSSAAKRIIPARMANGMTKLWKKLHPSQSIDKLFTRLGYHGFLEEMGEERVGALLRAVTGVEDFGADDPDNMFDRIISSIPDGEELLVEAGVLAFPGATKAGASKAVHMLRSRKEVPTDQPLPKKPVETREPVMVQASDRLAAEIGGRGSVNVDSAAQSEFEVPDDLIKQILAIEPKKEGQSDSVESATEKKPNIDAEPFRNFMDKRLEKEVEAQGRKLDELEVAEYELTVSKEINDFLRRRINKKKNPDIAEEVAEIPSQFATTDPNALSADEALDEINNAGLGVEFNNLREMTQFLQRSIESEKDLKARVADLKPKFIRQKDSSILKQKIANIKRGFRTGQRQGRREVKAVQNQVIEVLNDSGLSAADKAKFIKSVKNIQTVEQLEKQIDALANTAEARALRTKIKKELKSTKTTKQSGKPKGKFGADIQNILDRAREIIGMTREQASEAISRNLDSVEGIPPLEMVLENKLLSVMSGVDTKNVGELQDILDSIQTLKTTGKAGVFLKQLERREQHAGMIEDALKVIVGDKPLSEDRFDTFREKAKKIVDSSYLSLVGWNDKMDLLSQDDRASKQDQSALSNMARVSDEITAEKKGVRENAEEVVKFAMDAFGFTSEKQMLRQMREDAKPVSLGTFINGFGNPVNFKFTKAEARKRWMELQDPTLVETFTTAEMTESGKKVGMGYTAEMFDALNSFLTQEDVEFAKAQLDFYREYYQGTNEVYREMYGVDLPFNEFYSPISRKHGKSDTSSEFLKEIGFRRSVATGSLKSRVDNLRPIKEQSDVLALQKHIAEMEHFKGWATKMQDLNAIFGNGEVRYAIEKKFGKQMLRSIDAHLQDFTRGGIHRANNVALLEKMRTNFTRSALAIKPDLVVKQMVSFVAYAETIPAKDFAAGLADFAKNPAHAIRTLSESELMKERGSNINRDIKDLADSESFSMFRKNPTFFNSLLVNVRLGDRGAIILGGWPVYKKAINDGKTHAEALLKFERVTAQTQQSGDIDQLSDWQRGGSFAKLFTMFTSSQNQYFRREVAAVRNLIKGRVTLPEFMKKIAIYHFLLPMLFQWVVDFGRWDEKNQWRAGIMGSLNGLFIISDIMEAAIMRAQGERPFSKEMPLQTMGKGIEQAISAVRNEDIAEAMKDLLTGTVGPVSGLPIKQVFNFAEGASNVAEGEVARGGLKLLGWSPYSVDKVLDDF